MTLARLTNYVNGNVLTGPQLNAEFDNILNNGAALVSAAIPSVSIVRGLQGSIISNIGSFQANGYQLKSTSTIASLTATSSYSINTQTVGPIVNGRDQAAAFGSTTVHFYAITTGGTSTAAAGICSTRPPPLGPVLPAGYSAWAYLASAIYTVGSSVVARPWRVSGAKHYTPGSPIGPSIDMATTEVEINFGVYIPAVATRSYYLAGYTMTATAGGSKVQAQFHVGVESSPAAYDIVFSFSAVTTAGGTIIGYFPFELPNIATTPVIYGKSVPVVGLSAGNIPIVLGYSVPNGDVG